MKSILNLSEKVSIRLTNKGMNRFVNFLKDKLQSENETEVLIVKEMLGKKDVTTDLYYLEQKLRTNPQIDISINEMFQVFKDSVFPLFEMIEKEELVIKR